MDQKLKRIDYVDAMLKPGESPESVAPAVWEGERIPDDIRTRIEKEHLVSLDGCYGDPSLGEPVQFDGLTLVFQDRTVQITVWNRALILLLTDNEVVKRIHRVLDAIRLLRDGK